VQLEVLGELRLLAPPQPGRPLHLSAASGLVKVDTLLYVVADDELHLGVFPAAGNSPGTLIRMLDGELPDSADARKKLKPDFEALVSLPAFARYPHGALLALGSGSKPLRCRAVLLPLDARGVNVASLRVLDFSDWFVGVGAAIAEGNITRLNIEGAVVCGERLVLMHRGNKGDPANCLISFALHEVLASMERGEPVSKVPILGIERYDLGEREGVPLCFTDGAALSDGRLVFAAVAEDTADSYLDGPCRGAALGVIGSDGRLEALYPLEQSHKIEGVHAELAGSQVKLWLVTDADDAQIAAKLLRGVLPS
jgi:hypothetical protein